jgi:hypothetical protein
MHNNSWSRYTSILQDRCLGELLLTELTGDATDYEMLCFCFTLTDNTSTDRSPVYGVNESE